jgi:hypothetical protein
MGSAVAVTLSQFVLEKVPSHGGLRIFVDFLVRHDHWGTWDLIDHRIEPLPRVCPSSDLTEQFGRRPRSALQTAAAVPD